MAAQNDDSWLDTSDRQTVIAAFNREFGTSTVAQFWQAGSGCDAGSTSAIHRKTVFSRVNFFRSLAGVPGTVTENPQYSAKAQEAALMVARSGRLSHEPDSSFTCLTGDASEAAASSNLYLGLTGPDAINGYVRDEGVGDVGHRSVLLHPQTREMGTGDIPSGPSTHAANALWVFDDNVLGASVSTRESEGFVAWPPRGFVPSEVVYPAWSFALEGADFTNATVRMTHRGAEVPLTVSYRGSGAGAPHPAIVWQPDVDTNPSDDETYQVTVTGVAGTNSSFDYAVTLLDTNVTVASGEEFIPFVNRAHKDFLGRPASAAELDYWSGQLAGGLDRYGFVSELSSSDAWTHAVVDQLYRNTLGRPADEGGAAFWSRELRAGTPVATVAAAFYGSQEYVDAKGTTYEPWVADLYAVLLDRSVDAAGLTYWAGLAEDEGSGAVAHQLYQSEESRRARVTDLYQKFLGRDPDSAGLTYWAEQLSSGDDLALAANLAASAEYFNES